MRHCYIPISERRMDRKEKGTGETDASVILSAAV